MNFSLSEDHELLSNSLRRYFADNYDIETRNRTAYASPYHSDTIWSQLAELGTVGAFISEEQGGFAGTAMDVAVVFEADGQATAYLDGKKQQSAPSNFNFAGTNAGIGARFLNQNGNEFSGRMKDFQICRQALSQEEIGKLAEAAP